MDERKKEELEKFFQNADNSEEFILGDARLHIHVNKKFLFPYNLLDEARSVLSDTVKDFTIYFILSVGRKEIKSFKVDNGYINIVYCDIDSGEVNQLTLNMVEMLGIHPFFMQVLLPFFEYKVCKSGVTFEVSISDENMTRLKRKHPEIFSLFPEVCQKSNLFSLEFDIHHLIWQDQESEERIEKCDLLYIGKSNAEKSDFDILKRLHSHETIQKITRDNNLYYRSKELMIMIFSYHSKLYREYDFQDHNINILLGDSAWETAKLLTNIQENQEVILLIEAILINHFKPKYNTQYVGQISTNSKIYQEFKNQRINPVSIDLDLSMDWGKIELKTREEKTETKMRILECYKKDAQISIEYKDISDALYDIL